MAKKSIETVSDFMRTLEDEIEAVKKGDINENRGRVIFRGRALQLQAAALNLQYQRLRGNRPTERELKLINAPATETATPDPEAPKDKA